MLPEPTGRTVAMVLLLAAVLVVNHLVGRWLLRRELARRAGGRPPDPDPDADVDVDGGDGVDHSLRPTERVETVACPECGTANERGYRFCRGCVADLPGSDDRSRHGPGPLSGVVR